MTFTWDFGGIPNNGNANTSYPNSGVYTDGLPFPQGNLDFNGNRIIYLAALTARPPAYNASGIYYQIVKGGVWYAAGNVVPVSGGTFRFRIGYSGGTLRFHRDDDSGGSVIDEGGGSWAGQLSGTIHYQTVPLPVQYYSAAPNGVSGQIVVTFTAPASDGGTPVRTYPIRYSKDDGPWSDWVYNVSGSQLFTGLAAGLYKFQILASNDLGNSESAITNTVNLTGVRGKRMTGSAGSTAITIGRRYNSAGNPVNLSILKRYTGSVWADIAN